ncbi:MAG TPA: hypothetical protein VGD81_01610 [Opitutaceae bacterium]
MPEFVEVCERQSIRYASVQCLRSLTHSPKIGAPAPCGFALPLLLSPGSRKPELFADRVHKQINRNRLVVAIPRDQRSRRIRCVAAIVNPDDDWITVELVRGYIRNHLSARRDALNPKVRMDAPVPVSEAACRRALGGPPSNHAPTQRGSGYLKRLAESEGGRDAGVM